MINLEKYRTFFPLGEFHLFPTLTLENARENRSKKVIECNRKRDGIIRD